MPITVAELAAHLKGTLIGDGSRLVDSCNTLAKATPSQISFLHIPKYIKALDTTNAGAVILNVGQSKSVQRAENLPPLTAIEVKNPRYAWQQAIVKLHGYRQHPTIGISDKAFIHPTAKIGKNTNIHPFATVGENCEVGDNVNLYSNVTLMSGAKIGDDSTLYPSVTIYDKCIIGKRCILHAGCAIGTDGYGFATEAGSHHKIPHTGIVRVQDDVEIGGSTVIERAVLEETLIGQGTKLGNCVVIGHNCQIGPHNLLVSQVGIAGTTTTGKYVVMGGQVGIKEHLNIPDMVKIAAQSGVMMDPEPNSEIGGSPAMEASQAKRVYLQFLQLPDLAKRVKQLERDLAKLQPPAKQNP
jgi:UDP-3-O-[3-hydroxymyristoyl] glucosamine N-acyltransferase